jgi:hypothetical protein
MNSELMSEKRRKTIVDDLLSLRPKGETGQNPVYENETYWCYTAYKNKHKTLCDHEGWGYTDDTLWDLGFRSEDDVKSYVMRTFYNMEGTYMMKQGQKAGTTRKTNRLWSRMNQGIRRLRQSGAVKGVYKVCITWKNQFQFFGNSKSEIEMLAETMLKPIFPEAWKDGDSPSVSFVDKGDPSDILEANQELLDRISREVKDHRKRAEENLKKAEVKEQRVDYARDLIMQNFENALHAN